MKYISLHGTLLCGPNYRLAIFIRKVLWQVNIDIDSFHQVRFFISIESESDANLFGRDLTVIAKGDDIETGAGSDRR